MNQSASKEWNTSQEEFYNGRSHKRLWYDKSSVFIEKVVQSFIDFTGITKEDNILEVGCGAGRYTIPLLKRGYQITGVDLSRRVIEKLRDDAQRLNIPKEAYSLHCSEVGSFIQQSDQQFDAIIGFNTLHHLSDFSHTLGLLRHCLKKGGQTAFIEPNGDYLLHYVDAFFDRALKAEGLKKDCTPPQIFNSLFHNQYQEIDIVRFGFFLPALINLFPSLWTIESLIMKRQILKRFSAFFMVKGTNVVNIKSEDSSHQEESSSVPPLAEVRQNL